MTPSRSPFEVVVACNSDEILQANLLQSPEIADGSVRHIAERGFRSAGSAYAAGAGKTTAPYIVFAHQDVYFPSGWFARLRAGIERINQDHRTWGVIGVWGIAPSGRFAGRVWCTGGRREHVGSEALPAQAASIDEIVIVINAAAQLSFDPALPGYHLYATDIVLQAAEKGFMTFVIDAPVVHNSKANPRPVDRRYIDAYLYIRRKWWRRLPIKTCVLPVTWTGWPLLKHIARREIRLFLKGGPPAEPIASSATKARELGYDRHLRD